MSEQRGIVMNGSKVLALIALIIAIVIIVLYIVHVTSFNFTIFVLLGDLVCFLTAEVLVT